MATRLHPSGPGVLGTTIESSEITDGTIIAGDLATALAARVPTSLPVSVAQGGHGATTAAGARTALDLEPGVDFPSLATFNGLVNQDVRSGAAPVLAAANLTGLPPALPTYVGIDPGLTVPADYEWHGDGLRLKHYTDFSFLAAGYDVLVSGAPPGWAHVNTGKVASVVANVAGSGRLEATAGGVPPTATWWAGEHSAYMLGKDRHALMPGDELVARIAIAGGAAYTNEETFEAGIYYATTATPTVFTTNFNLRADVGSSGGAGHRFRGGVDGSKPPVAGVGQAQNEAGIWIRIVHHGRFIGWYYDTTVDVLPPDRRATRIAWTPLSILENVVPTGQDSAPIRYGCVVGSHTNAAADHTGTLGYMEYRAVDGDSVNCGTKSGNTDIQLIDDLDIGAAATLTDANLRAGLVAAVNQRPLDRATATFSCVRSATVGAVAGAWASAAAATVSGTGRYLSLWLRMNSTGLLQGSVRRNLALRLS